MTREKSILSFLGMMIVGAALAITSCTSEPTPPAAKKVARADTVLGYERIDDYYWLRERSNPEVLDYLKAENAYTEAVMKHTGALQKKLYEEMVGRIKEEDATVPVRLDDYYYYSRTEEGKQYRIYCCKKGGLDAPEQVILDVNELAEGKEFMSVGLYKISPDHKILAYSTDDKGSERYTLRFKNLETGRLLPDVVDSVASSGEWANDNKTFFYTVPDEAWRPFRLFRHKLGTDSREDHLVFQEDDDAFWMELYKTKSKAYLMIRLGSEETSEVHYLSADKPQGEFRVIHPRQQGMEYTVRHHDKNFYILTNDEAKNFRLMVTPVSRSSKRHWKEVIPHSKSVKLDDIELFKDNLVVYEREGGLKKIRIRDLWTSKEHVIDFPEPAYSIHQQWNPDFNAHVVRFVYESMVTPASTYDYDMNTRKRELKKRKEVLGGYNPDDYVTERIFAEADDGVMVPISLVHKKGLARDGRNPAILHGYGSYGASSDPWFSSNSLSLLDRGLVIAVAHVRGGGEMGRYWYEDGKLLKKGNTFTDFIACAEHLIREGYTSSDRLGIEGISAGGLTIGAVVNMRPDLFKVVVADVPFVDVVNTMLDETIPLTVIEYEEWGNPNEKEYYDYMMTYSPYDNVSAQDYPNMLITAGLNDTRVQYWEPAKWTAKLRSFKTDNNRLLLKTNMGAGHGGVSGRYERFKEIAFEYAFVLDVLGIKD
jgi:oligopeptidase B